MTEPQQMFKSVFKRGLIALVIAALVAVSAWFVLPPIELGQWSWLVRGAIVVVIGIITFAIGWFITILKTGSEVFDGW